MKIKEIMEYLKEHSKYMKGEKLKLYLTYINALEDYVKNEKAIKTQNKKVLN
jgi:hypothetical protein